MQRSTDHNMICGDKDSPQDVILCIEQRHIGPITSGEKNHEFRDYILDAKVRRVWLYVNELKTIQYVLTIGTHKVPGEVDARVGLGNAEFNQGLKPSHFGYQILSVYVLPRELTIKELLLDFEVDMVTKGKQYNKQALVDHFPLETLKEVVPKAEMRRELE